MNLTDKMPPYYTDNELTKKLSVLPEIKPDDTSKQSRLLNLLSVYDLFIPTNMAREIYSTVYFALVRSLNRKSKLYDTYKMNDNRKVINGRGITSGINGGDCSLIVGDSGVGKSQSIARAVSIISENSVIETESPYCTVIPVMTVEASPMVSIKGFFLEILRVMDSIIGTDYYMANNRTTINTDSLLGAVSNALLLHCGVLIVDEVDRLVGNKKSYTFVNFITELLNMCGISVIFVGTPRAIEFFSSTEYLSRRSMGNVYRQMPYGNEYYGFCKELFNYQFTLHKTELDSNILRLFYKYSNGIAALTVQLFVAAQQIAISNDYEKLDMLSISQAFTDKMSIITPYAGFGKHIFPNARSQKELSETDNGTIPFDYNNIFENLSARADKSADKAIEILSKYITVECIKL